MSGGVEYKSLDGKKFFEIRKTTALAVVMITLGVALALVFLFFSFQETFLDENLPKTDVEPTNTWLYEINETVSLYNKEDYLIKRPIILLPQVKQPIQHKLICYYVFPSLHDDLQPEYVDVNLCTHINIAFAHIDVENNTIALHQHELDVLPKIVDLKAHNNNLKILISVGGAGGTGFSEMVKTHKTRKKFIGSLMFFIKLNNLDGVDVDWEFPVVDGNVKERLKFQQLLNEIRREFDLHKRKYILSVAVSAVKSYIDMAYYVVHMNEVVDYVNLMTYDYHFYVKYFPLTADNAPLYSLQNDPLLRDLNVNFSTDYWIAQGMASEKIILGLPAYGHTYRLVNPDNHGLMAPASGIGTLGQNGYATVLDICNFLKLKYTVSVVDNVSLVPYAFNSYNWVSYDDFNSYVLKVKLIQNKRLGGAMVWAMNIDDYNGSCYNKTFPMIRLLNTLLIKNQTAVIKNGGD